MSAPARLTMAHQALANLTGYACVSIYKDQAFADVMVMLEDILPAARVDLPDRFRPMVEAAEALVRLWPEVRKTGSTAGADWCRAMMDAQAACQAFFLGRACAALETHAREQVPAAADPAPAVPNPEPAHAEP